MSERTPQQVCLDLQKLARAEGRNTQQLFELYIHERFLAAVELVDGVRDEVVSCWHPKERRWE